VNAETVRFYLLLAVCSLGAWAIVGVWLLSEYRNTVFRFGRASLYVEWRFSFRFVFTASVLYVEAPGFGLAIARKPPVTLTPAEAGRSPGEAAPPLDVGTEPPGDLGASEGAAEPPSEGRCSQPDVCGCDRDSYP